MSVHQRGKSWLVRFRDADGVNRGRSFSTKREAEEFDRRIREAKSTAVAEALRKVRAS